MRPQPASEPTVECFLHLRGSARLGAAVVLIRGLWMLFPLRSEAHCLRPRVAEPSALERLTTLRIVFRQENRESWMLQCRALCWTKTASFVLVLHVTGLPPVCDVNDSRRLHFNQSRSNQFDQSRNQGPHGPFGFDELDSDRQGLATAAGIAMRVDPMMRSKPCVAAQYRSSTDTCGKQKGDDLQVKKVPIRSCIFVQMNNDPLGRSRRQHSAVLGDGLSGHGVTSY